MDENVDSLQKGCVFVSSSSQKLGVDLLVGFEDCVIFGITAVLKQKQRSEVHRDACQQLKKTPNHPQERPVTLHGEAGALVLCISYSPSVSTVHRPVHGHVLHYIHQNQRSFCL